jgi:uroporphyrin-III C-methyltransferase/precorrin-2 dehydrogenase/sirohydrochlorin ferrochelatase/precorrin-2 dehydrogenase/sirohydrochlorin ferrochelatase
MYIDVKKKPCLIAGGGKVAYRKAVVMLDFEAEVQVVAPQVCGELLALSPLVDIQTRPVSEEDCVGKTLVIAAMDDAARNHEIAQFCKASGIPVNAVDQKEDCSFIFPSYVRAHDLVAAFSSGGKSPVMTQYLKAREQEILTKELGELNDCLGSYRDEVQRRVPTEELRKEVYLEILALGLEKGETPSHEEIENILEQTKK